MGRWGKRQETQRMNRVDNSLKIKRLSADVQRWKTEPYSEVLVHTANVITLFGSLFKRPSQLNMNLSASLQYTDTEGGKSSLVASVSCKKMSFFFCCHINN